MTRGCASFHVLLKVLVCSCLCDSTYATPAFKSFIDINKNGSLATGTQLPACHSGRKIQIMKNTYYKRLCSTVCLFVTTENVSPEIEARLYEMCSYKEKCTTMEFSSTSVEHGNIIGINISYQCVDSESVVHMCKNRGMYSTSDTHIMATGPMNLYKVCRCFIEEGTFRITITDLRLKSIMERNCSSITLTIQSKRYDCNTPDYENIFNQPVGKSVTNAFISLKSSAIENSAAEMVWITLQPEDSSHLSIQCFSIPKNTSNQTQQRDSNQSSSEPSIHRDTKPSYSTLHSTNVADTLCPFTQSESNELARGLLPVYVLLSVIGGFITCGILTFFIICIVRRRRKRNRRTDPSELEAELHELPDQMQSVSNDNTGVTYEALSEGRSGTAYETLPERPLGSTYESLSENRPGPVYKSLLEQI